MSFSAAACLLGTNDYLWGSTLKAGVDAFFITSFSHGLAATFGFLFVGILYKHTSTRSIVEIRGLLKSNFFVGLSAIILILTNFE